MWPLIKSRPSARALLRVSLGVCLSIVLVALPPPLRAEESDGAGLFAARCAVCHGPQAAGIPGTFPSLHEQVVAFAKSPEGRDYLIMVVSSGLMGELKVGGVRYNNVMPAQSGLSEADVAAVLSYLSGAAIAAADVKEARARHADNSAQSTHTLRPADP